jgi:hypothetical protein
LALAVVLWPGPHADAAVTADIQHLGTESASPAFRFDSLPPPARNDAATTARFFLVDGSADPNSGPIDRLHDGQVPAEEDSPRDNFFLRAGTVGGRVAVDLGREIDTARVNSYSWHPGPRGPQVYTLYASNGAATNFNPTPKAGTDPAGCGWTRLAQVDARPDRGEPGGQYAVSIASTDGSLGRWRHLLFDLERTEADDPFGHTFYSEIDVIDRAGPAPESAIPPAPPAARQLVETEDGRYQIVLDTTDTPDLTDWVRTQMAPVARTWYPRLVDLLPSEGYAAPGRVTIAFSARMSGVAATSGSRIRCAAGWFRQNLEGEAKGAVVHELVHVVQAYGRNRRSAPDAVPAPGWLVEGIADYLRWFRYEPESKGAEVRNRNVGALRYDASYRVTANFLNWVVTRYDPDLVKHLNAALRQGRYREDLWKERTGHPLAELGEQWRENVGRSQE